MVLCQCASSLPTVKLSFANISAFAILLLLVLEGKVSFVHMVLRCLIQRIQGGATVQELLVHSSLNIILCCMFYRSL